MQRSHVYRVRGVDSDHGNSLVAWCCGEEDGAFVGLMLGRCAKAGSRCRRQKFTTVQAKAGFINIIAMAPSRAYAPSRALLRALARPLPRRCSLLRPSPALVLRRNGSKATNANPYGNGTRNSTPDDDNVTIKFSDKLKKGEGMSLPDAALDDPSLPTISWYEQDLDGAGPERLVSRLATSEDRRKHNELAKMLEEDAEDPDYDDAQLRRRLLDDLMANPSFAHLTEELQTLKEDVMTREESRAVEDYVRRKQEPQLKELESTWHMATHESIQELIDDPAMEDTRDDLKDLQAKLPEIHDAQNPEFQAAVQRVEEKLAGNQAFQKRLAALQKENGQSTGANMEQLEKEINDMDENAPVDSPEALDSLLVQMKELMGSMGGDKELQAELDAIIKDNPLAETDEDEDNELNFDGLSQELTKLVKSSAPAGASKIDDNGDVVDPELEAKVDKIMQDPKLVEKLMYIKKLIAEAQSKPSDMTAIAHETAPDPLTLESSSTASLQERIQMAKSDPEHLAALDRLRVDLQPPFNISPALKAFNQAIELSYVGANDDIRRILWRTYTKARTLPTFLQNLSDDAWDLLYYSQAVTWGSNQNRQDHLKALLHDLRSVGRSGPPTHPSTLVRN
jgi:hypothetical protein